MSPTSLLTWIQKLTTTAPAASSLRGIPTSKHAFEIFAEISSKFSVLIKIYKEYISFENLPISAKIQENRK